MKIGYFVSHFPYEGYLENVRRYVEQYTHTGTIDAAYNLAINMARMGHEVSVFTSSIDNRNSLEKRDNMTIFRYGTNFRALSANISAGMFINPLKHKMDLAHAHIGVPPAADAALWYAKKKKVPFILTYHADQDSSYGPLFRRVALIFYNNVFLPKIFSNAKVIIATSHHYINESRFLRPYKDKVVVIPNGIDLNSFNINYSKKECREKLELPPSKKVILFVGLLTSFKGPDILIKAMPKILEHIPDTILVFVGEGPLRQRLEEKAKKLGVEEFVKFAGFVKESVKHMYYKSSDILALPSISTAEAFGIVNLEAMAFGIPIVSTKIGGIPEVVKDCENGLLVPPKDPEALANGIISLLVNQDVRIKMSKNNREKVQNYSWERIAFETEKVYMRILNS